MELTVGEIDKLGKILLINGTSTKKKLFNKKCTTFVEFVDVESAKKYYFDIIQNIENVQKNIDSINNVPIEPQEPFIKLQINKKYNVKTLISEIKNDVTDVLNIFEKEMYSLLELYNENLIKYKSDLDAYNNLKRNYDWYLIKLQSLHDDLILFHTKFVIIKNNLYEVGDISVFSYNDICADGKSTPATSSVAGLFSKASSNQTGEKISTNSHIIASTEINNNQITLTVYNESNVDNKVKIVFNKID